MKDHSNLCKIRIIEGLQEDCTCPYKLIEPLLDRINRLEWALSKLAILHNVCEDDWYSCDVTDDHGHRCEGNNQECTCGADDHNKFIADTLKEGLSIREQYFNEASTNSY